MPCCCLSPTDNSLSKRAMMLLFHRVIVVFLLVCPHYSIMCARVKGKSQLFIEFYIRGHLPHSSRGHCRSFNCVHKKTLPTERSPQAALLSYKNWREQHKPHKTRYIHHRKPQQKFSALRPRTIEVIAQRNQTCERGNRRTESAQIHAQQ